MQVDSLILVDLNIHSHLFSYMIPKSDFLSAQSLKYALVFSFGINFISRRKAVKSEVTDGTESTESAEPPCKIFKTKTIEHEGYLYNFNKSIHDGMVEYYSCSNKVKQVNKVKVLNDSRYFE